MSHLGQYVVRHVVKGMKAVRLIMFPLLDMPQLLNLFALDKRQLRLLLKFVNKGLDKLLPLAQRSTLEHSKMGTV